MTQPHREITVDSSKTKLLNRALSRRTFLAGAGSVAAGAVVAGCGGSSSTITVTPPVTTYTDVDILNFALNLEYLEAEFYLRAATGNGLTAADAGTSAGTVTGGSKVAGLTTAQQNILNEIAYDEQEHVRFLRSALGSSAVSRPNLDLTAFNALAIAAGINTTGFNPFTSGFDGFVVGAFVFEDVGVTAYNGAAPLISTAGITAGYLAAAAGIMAVEAYHAAYVRTYLTAQAYLQGTTAYPFYGYANKVSVLRGQLGGGNETALSGAAATPTTVVGTAPSSIVACDTTNAIAFNRTTDQVLHIVYGTFSNTAGSTTPAAGVTKGGFFPNGLNGNISATKS